MPADHADVSDVGVGPRITTRSSSQRTWRNSMWPSSPPRAWARRTPMVASIPESFSARSALSSEPVSVVGGHGVVLLRLAVTDGRGGGRGEHGRRGGGGRGEGGHDAASAPGMAGCSATTLPAANSPSARTTAWRSARFSGPASTSAGVPARHGRPPGSDPAHRVGLGATKAGSSGNRLLSLLRPPRGCVVKVLAVLKPGSSSQ